ncbi:hypothetical protein C8R45DRAFT_628722 [Mycena sanguinolenta]|nr:hypothetical protein C8R45DRAFT_628722 [Mycena sanguinolenta]
MTMISSEFSFPPELEREIFEATATLFPRFIPTLLRICHRVHVWIEPLLYRVAIISGPSRFTHWLKLVKSKAPLLRIGVRHILIQIYPSGPMNDYKNLLTTCTGSINISIGGEIDLDFLRGLSEMRPRRLAFTVPGMFFTCGLDGFKHPLFESVTHLDLYCGSALAANGLNWETWSDLASIPALTHLALSYPIACSILSQVVSQCRRLAVAIVATYSWEHEREVTVSYAQNLGFADARVVVMILNADYVADWELGACRGEDFWIRAEAFVNRKRAGEIETSSYLLDERTE